MRIGRIVSILLFVLILIGIGFWVKEVTKPKETKLLSKVRIATTFSSFTGYPFFIAEKQGYFIDQGLDVILKNFPHGKANLNAITTEEADFAASSETPFIRAVLSGKKLSIVASTSTAENHLAVVARKDHGIVEFQDLVGKSIGVTFGSNSEYFLEIMLTVNNLTKDQFNFIDTKPNKMVEVIESGAVDAIVTWNPNHHNAQVVLGERGTVFYGNGIYSPSFIVVSSDNYLQNNSSKTKKLIRALETAANFIRSNPEASRKIVSEYTLMEEDQLSKLSSSYHFKITLSQFLLTILNNQAEWTLKKNGKPISNAPNFLNHIYLDGLDSVNPTAVTIIR